MDTQHHSAADGAQVRAGELIELGQANDEGLIPRRRGRKRSRTELWRMVTSGRRNAAGERIVLRTVREGRTVYTTRAWLDDYFGAFAVPVPGPVPAREARRRSYANTHPTPQCAPDAAAALRRHGLGDAAGLGD